MSHSSLQPRLCFLVFLVAAVPLLFLLQPCSWPFFLRYPFPSHVFLGCHVFPFFLRGERDKRTFSCTLDVFHVLRVSSFPSFFLPGHPNLPSSSVSPRGPGRRAPSSSPSRSRSLSSSHIGASFHSQNVNLAGVLGFAETPRPSVWRQNSWIE